MVDIVHTGRVWKFGDQINTDIILPAAGFSLPDEERNALVFSAIRPGWAKAVQPGDIVVGGHNFGLGSGRPVGAVLRACGIVGLVAESINGLCLRNCVNFSLPGIDCPGVAAAFEEGEIARVDFVSGTVCNVTRGTTLQGRGLPSLLAQIVAAGGVIPMLAKEGLIEATPTNVATA